MTFLIIHYTVHIPRWGKKKKKLIMWYSIR